MLDGDTTAGTLGALADNLPQVAAHRNPSTEVKHPMCTTQPERGALRARLPSLRKFLGCLLLVCPLLGGCGESSVQVSATAPSVATIATVALTVNGTAQAPLDLNSWETRRCLPELVPDEAVDPATWTMLEAHTVDGRILKIPKPAERHPKQDFCLYVSKDGRPSFGIFRRDAPDLHPRLRELLDQPSPYMEGLSRITVRTTQTAEEKRHEALFGTLNASVDGGDDHPITLEMLAGLSPPAPGEKAAMVWPLRDVLALILSPERIRSLRVVSLGGEARELDASALKGDATTTYVLKHNKKGDFHVRTLVDGARGPQQRSVIRLEITTGYRVR
jgi:hypothetical protein